MYPQDSDVCTAFLVHLSCICTSLEDEVLDLQDSCSVSPKETCNVQALFRFLSHIIQRLPVRVLTDTWGRYKVTHRFSSKVKFSGTMAMESSYLRLRNLDPLS